MRFECVLLLPIIVSFFCCQWLTNIIFSYFHPHFYSFFPHFPPSIYSPLFTSFGYSLQQTMSSSSRQNDCNKRGRPKGAARAIARATARAASIATSRATRSTIPPTPLVSDITVSTATGNHSFSIDLTDPDAASASLKSMMDRIATENQEKLVSAATDALFDMHFTESVDQNARELTTREKLYRVGVVRDFMVMADDFRVKPGLAALRVPVLEDAPVEHRVGACGALVFLLSREFYNDWRSLVVDVPPDWESRLTQPFPTDPEERKRAEEWEIDLYSRLVFFNLPHHQWTLDRALQRHAEAAQQAISYLMLVVEHWFSDTVKGSLSEMTPQARMDYVLERFHWVWYLWCVAVARHLMVLILLHYYWYCGHPLKDSLTPLESAPDREEWFRVVRLLATDLIGVFHLCVLYDTVETLPAPMYNAWIRDPQVNSVASRPEKMLRNAVLSFWQFRGAVADHLSHDSRDGSMLYDPMRWITPATEVFSALSEGRGYCLPDDARRYSKFFSGIGQVSSAAKNMQSQVLELANKVMQQPATYSVGRASSAKIMCFGVIQKYREDMKNDEL